VLIEAESSSSLFNTPLILLFADREEEEHDNTLDVVGRPCK
jgi:hypothetical protein